MEGRTISHYRILSKLGEGGMGVVYKAEDTRLERTVALKFLAAQLVSDEATRKRFEREAKAVAALDHPNICTMFEIDEAEGTVFLAMAFVEGPTVKEKIAQRPLKLAEALEIAEQTAEGLRAAHEKGIVHRDIKPANVMLNSRGQVKIMDFGLARLTDATITQTATIVGTPAYMSPEQSQGLFVDHRSDIWSLGVMLYEMIVGRLPFPGQRPESVFHAIQSAEPEPLTALRTGVPMQLELLVAKCLAKNPAERYQHIDDLIVDLSTLRKRLESGAFVPASTSSVTQSLSPPPQTQAAPVRRPAIRKAALLAAIGAAVVLAILVGMRVFRHSPETGALRTVKFSITPTQLLRGGEGEVDTEVSISNDGRHIAYVESQGGQLWVRAINEEQAHPVPGATGVYQAFWSPDNQYIGYAAGRYCGARAGCDLMRIPVQGGTPVTIVKLQGPFRRASWSSDGETIVYCEAPTGMFTVPARGGTPTRIVEHTHIEHPSFLDLPGGRRAFLYQEGIRGKPDHGIYVQAAGDKQNRLLAISTSNNPYPVYSPTGHIIYVDGFAESSAIWALPFSLDTLQATGKAFPIVQHGSSPAMSRTGTLVYSDVPSNRTQLTLIDRSGAKLSTIGEPQRQVGPILSPDGRKVAVEIMGGENDIWIYDLDRGIKSRFTFDPAPEMAGAWIASGDLIAYDSNRNGNFDIFIRPAGANVDATLLAGTPQDERFPDLSSDGRFVIYNVASPGTKSDLFYRERRKDGSSGEPVVFLKTPFNEGMARFSPDGRFVVYLSDESGRNEVYVRDFPKGEHKWQISANGGASPRWRQDREILYLEGPKLMAVTVAIRPAFSPGAAAALFDKRPVPFSQYDVSSDGKRLVILQRPAGEPPLAIHVVHNWFEEFRAQQREQGK